MSLIIGNSDKPFDSLLDAIKTSAIQRGREHPDWVDVWIGITSTPDYAVALRQRGVMVGHFKTEVQYLAHFVDIQDISMPDSRYDLVMRALDELVEESRVTSNWAFNALPIQTPERNQMIQHAFDGMFLQKMTDLQKNLDTSDEANQMADMKMDIIRHVCDEAIKTLIMEQSIADSTDDPAELDEMLAGLRRLASRKLSDLYADNIFVSPMPGFNKKGEQFDVIEILKKMQTSPLSPPTPVEVIDAVTAKSGFVFETLLMRNGLRARSADVEDTLADTMPDIAVQETMLRALDITYARNEKSMTAAHVTEALLGHPSVRTHLIRLGVKDLVELDDKFRKNMAEPDEVNKSRIKVHPTIGADMLELVEKLNGQVKEKGHIAEALRWVIKQDTEIKKALSKSGLTAAMVKNWESAYDKSKGDSTLEADEGPEVPDAQLEQLISAYCKDLTAEARKKSYDPTIGEEATVEAITTTLIKRGKKNVIVIGEPGTGKSAVTGPALAQAFISGKDIPEELVGARLLQLDLHQMNDSPYIGIFESRIIPILKGIAERNIKRDGPPIVLQLPEFGQAMNAGGHSSSPGVKGLILPFLTEGGLLVVADCTAKEYGTNIESSPPLARRFEAIHKETPDNEKTAKILKGIKLKYSQHHGLRIPETLLPKIAQKADQYIVNSNQPDKSIDLLDAACAQAKAQGAKTLEESHVNIIVSNRARIPLSFLQQSDSNRYANMESDLNKDVLAQEQAVKAVSSAIKRARVGLNRAAMPLGKFLFVGPTGVGKTELTKAVARHILGSDAFITRYDMGEYGEKTAAKRFIGGDPNFVGYEEGGLLIRNLRSRPYGINLFDEVEKAHEDVWNVLLGVLDGAKVTDGRGVSADMNNGYAFMTSNVGAAEVMKEGAKLALDPIKDYEAWQSMARPIYQAAVENHFKPEFLNRLDDIIYFNSLSPDTMKELVRRQFNETAGRLKERHNLDLKVSSALEQQVSEKGYDVRYGARPLGRAWQNIVVDPIADFLLTAPKRSLKKARMISLDVPEALPSSHIEEALRGMTDVAQIRKLLEGAEAQRPQIELLYG